MEILVLASPCLDFPGEVNQNPRPAPHPPTLFNLVFHETTPARAPMHTQCDWLHKYTVRPVLVPTVGFNAGGLSASHYCHPSTTRPLPTTCSCCGQWCTWIVFVFVNMHGYRVLLHSRSFTSGVSLYPQHRYCQKFDTQYTLDMKEGCEIFERRATCRLYIERHQRSLIITPFRGQRSPPCLWP